MQIRVLRSIYHPPFKVVCCTRPLIGAALLAVSGASRGYEQQHLRHADLTNSSVWKPAAEVSEDPRHPKVKATRFDEERLSTIFATPAQLEASSHCVQNCERVSGVVVTSHVPLLIKVARRS